MQNVIVVYNRKWFGLVVIIVKVFWWGWWGKRRLWIFNRWMGMIMWGTVVATSTSACVIPLER